MKAGQVVNVAHFLLRIVAGLMFFQSGAMKTFGWFGGMPGTGGGTASLATQVGFGGLLEVIGGAMIVLGLFTRPAAFILAGEMAIAYFQFHQPRGFWPIENAGVSAVLYCFIFLTMAASGGGPWSADALIRRWRSPAGRAPG